MGYPWVGRRGIDEGAGNAPRRRFAGPSITSGKTATIAAFRVLLIRRRPETNQTQHRAEIRGPPRGNHTGRSDQAPRPTAERAPSVRARSLLTVRRGWCKPGSVRYLRATSGNGGEVFTVLTWVSSNVMIVWLRNLTKPAGMMITRPTGARARSDRHFQMIRAGGSPARPDSPTGALPHCCHRKRLLVAPSKGAIVKECGPERVSCSEYCESRIPRHSQRSLSSTSRSEYSTSNAIRPRRLRPMGESPLYTIWGI